MISDILSALATIGIVMSVWLCPILITSIIGLMYDPVVKVKRSGTGKVLNMCVLVFYKWRRRTLMVKKEICPLCHRSDMRCRVTIHPITGVRMHSSLVMNRRRTQSGRRANSGWQRIKDIHNGNLDHLRGYDDGESEPQLRGIH